MIELKLMNDKEALNYTEECLYNYPANLTRIEVLKKDLQVLRSHTDVTIQNYVRIYSGDDIKKGKKSDPVASFYEKIEYLEEQIEQIKRDTEPLSKMIQDLKSPYSTNDSLNADFIKILGLYYFGRNSVAIVLDTTHWSRAGFFRKKNQLVKLARNYLGY